MPIIYFYFFYMLTFFKKFKILNLFIILLICTNIYGNNNFIKLNKHKTDENKICSDEALSTPNFFIDKMRLEVFSKICKK